jgi:hypothetical protein
MNNAQYFFNGCAAFDSFVESIFQERGHAVLDGNLLDFAGVSTPHERFTDEVVHFQYLIDAHAPAIAGVVADGTSFAL